MTRFGFGKYAEPEGHASIFIIRVDSGGGFEKHLRREPTEILIGFGFSSLRMWSLQKTVREKGKSKFVYFFFHL